MARLLGSLKLVATRTAISCSRMFVAHTLEKWNADLVIDDAVLLTDELITNAVKVTGTMDEHPDLANAAFIAMRVLGLETSIRIEVWDGASSDPPILPGKTTSLVQRGSYLASGGKVVWAELSLTPPRRSLPLLPPEERFRSRPDNPLGGDRL